MRIFSPNKIVLAVLFVSILMGCSLFDSEFKKLVDNYYVGWVDEKSNRAVFYLEGDSLYITIVPPCVESIGWNDNFIIVQRRSLDDKKFYIVNIKQNRFSSDHLKGLLGPLSLDQFNKEQSNLGIMGKISFTDNYKGCK